MILDGNILPANHFLRRHGEERTRFHRRVIRDNHEGAPANFGKSSDRARGRRAAPLLVHFERRVNSQLEKLRTWIDQLADTLTRREAAFLVLRFNRFGAAALANLLLFILYFRKELDD